LYVIILCIFNINYILLEISGSHSNIISDSYVFHYGNELVFPALGIRKFVTLLQRISIKSTPLQSQLLKMNTLPNHWNKINIGGAC